MLSTAWVELSLGAMTLIGVMFTALIGYKAARHAAEVNDAVNHRHTSEPRLLDMVRMTWQRGEHTADQVDELRADLTAHVKWEESQKYQTPDQIKQLIEHHHTDPDGG